MALTRNRPIDSRLAATVGPDGSAITVQRGFIRTQDGKYTFRFLWNPTTVSVTYGIDMDLNFNVSNARDPRDPGKYYVMPNQRLSFRLLLDRTYEVWERTMPKGVEEDIEVLRGVLGMYDSIPTPSTGSSDVYGIMLFSPVDIVLASQSPLRYFGVIEQAGINYTLTTWDQIPTRCEVEISVRLMPRTAFNSTGGGAGGSAGGGGAGTIEPGEPTSRPRTGDSSTSRPFPGSADAAERWQNSSGSDKLQRRLDEEIDITMPR